MGKFKFGKASISIAVLSFLLTTGVFAQDKKDDSCCSSMEKKCEKMDHAQMDHAKMDHSTMSHTNMNNSSISQDSTQRSVLTVKEVDSKSEAWNAVCPVRGEVIDTEANKVEYNGKVYGFCCNGCDSKFIKDPEKYSKNLGEDGKTFVGSN